MNPVIFNYIVAVQNKQDSIGKLLESVVACCRENSHVYAIFDSFTDESEAVVDGVLMQNSDVRLTKVYTHDVRQILSLNAGLRAACQEQEGYNITIQDNVVLLDRNLEERISLIYEHLGYENVGVLSFRAGANILLDAQHHDLKEVDAVESSYGAGASNSALFPERAVEKMVGIGSPWCISTRAIHEVGYFDERLAPHSYASHDLALRCLEHGYRNFVFGLPFQSEPTWGGTLNCPNLEDARIQKRNRRYLYYRHAGFLATFPYKEFEARTGTQFTIPGIVATQTPSDSALASDAERRSQPEQSSFSLKRARHDAKSFLGRASANPWIGRVRAHAKARVVAPIQEWFYGRYQARYDRDLTFDQVMSCFPDRNRSYEYLHHYFRHKCPKEIQAHRHFFHSNGRGFGEDAHHAAWWLLLKETQPAKCLEIGVYRGQVITLWALIAKICEFKCDVHAISPFSPAGDGVSRYADGIDYLQDTLKSFSHFELPLPTTVQALSCDAQAIQHVQAQTWDLMYIDGCHDFEVALADYQLCRQHLGPQGVLVLDDSSLDSQFAPLKFAFAGHPGPSTVASMYAMRDMQFIGAAGHLNFFRPLPVT